MRRGIMTRLVLLAMAAPITIQSAAYAEKVNKPAVSAPTFNKELEGKARASREEAVESALQMACDEIAAYLHNQKPALIWIPDPAYVREHLLDDVPEASGEEWTREQLNGHTILVRKDKFNVDGAPFTYQVRLRAVVNSQELTHMRQLDEPYREKVRQGAVHQRQLWLGKILLGVVVFLGSLSGYIRLEDATKGYYTGWLRLGLVGVLCAVGAGLWLAS